MRLLPDPDVLILIATALAAKRRPATLTEIVAAADLVQGCIPYAAKLEDAMRWLSNADLISIQAAGYALTPDGEAIMTALPKHAEMEERIAIVQNSLASHSPKRQGSTIELSPEQLASAIHEHEATKKRSGQNLAMPKPKLDRHFKVEGRWRCAPGSRERKS
jgi:hypothetical protein